MSTYDIQMLFELNSKCSDACHSQIIIQII